MSTKSISEYFNAQGGWDPGWTSLKPSQSVSVCAPLLSQAAVPGKLIVSVNFSQNCAPLWTAVMNFSFHTSSEARKGPQTSHSHLVSPEQGIVPWGLVCVGSAPSFLQPSLSPFLLTCGHLLIPWQSVILGHFPLASKLKDLKLNLKKCAARLLFWGPSVWDAMQIQQSHKSSHQWSWEDANFITGGNFVT